PPVARGGGAAASARMKEMPDEGTLGARVLSRDGDAKAARPAGERALGCGVRSARARAGSARRGRAPASALMTASATSCAQWLVARVTGAGGFGHTMVPGLALLSTGRQGASFF